MKEPPAQEPAHQARFVAAAAETASLATLMADAGSPYASLVLVALDYDGAPLLLLSDLAEHSRNLAKKGEAALLFDGTVGYDSRLTGPRVTYVGGLQPLAAPSPAQQHRFLARHPDAAGYAQFADFKYYRMAIEKGHLVAGFGAIHWLDGADLQRPAPADLGAEEAGLVARLNATLRTEIGRFCSRKWGPANETGEIIGLDAEGVDVRCQAGLHRLAFAGPVHNTDSAVRQLTDILGKNTQDSA